MSRSSSWLGRLCIRVPRARGDEPSFNGFAADPRFVFPAPAGMSRVLTVSRSSNCCVPRARGDEPVLEALAELPAPCSPRPRG